MAVTGAFWVGERHVRERFALKGDCWNHPIKVRGSLEPVSRGREHGDVRRRWRRSFARLECGSMFLSTHLGNQIKCRGRHALRVLHVIIHHKSQHLSSLGIIHEFEMKVVFANLYRSASVRRS